MDKIKTENSETEILIAAKEIFHQKGMAGARMQEIADKFSISCRNLFFFLNNIFYFILAIIELPKTFR